MQQTAESVKCCGIRHQLRGSIYMLSIVPDAYLEGGQVVAANDFSRCQLLLSH